MGLELIFFLLIFSFFPSPRKGPRRRQPTKVDVFPLLPSPDGEKTGEDCRLSQLKREVEIERQAKPSVPYTIG